jgi:hypothetical protein
MGDITSEMLKDIQDCFNGGYRDDMAFAVEKVLPCNIINYRHPTKRIPDPYGIFYKPDYDKLKSYGYVISNEITRKNR